MLLPRILLPSPLFPGHSCPIFRQCFFATTASRHCKTEFIGSGDEEKDWKRSQQRRKKPILKEKPKRNTALALWDQALKSVGLRRHRNPDLTNAGYAHHRGGFEPVDIEVPLEVLVKDAPKWYVNETKKLIKEIKQRPPQLPWFNVQLDRDKRGVAHGETDIRYEFKTDEDFAIWQASCDSDSSEGYSKCNFYRSDRGTAILEGTLSTRLVKDGKTQRAGWCGMRSTLDKLAFGRKKRVFDWIHYTHLVIKCRGDGRSYKVLLHVPKFIDMTWGDSYSYPLHTHGGPYWQYEFIPFSRFISTVNGRIMDYQYSIDTFDISSVGITLMDRINGPFRLEVDFIGATKHSSHLEEFAYETYNIPLGHPEQ